jgi:asparagine synthase (glutamine-hydrolysing)
LTSFLVTHILTIFHFPPGYLYFHAAPDSASFHQETVRRVKNLHTSDCLRANKYVSDFKKEFRILKQKLTRSTMAWGLEARVPFLDKQFLEVSMNIDPSAKAFSKGAKQETDQDGCPKMEKVS